jgi:cytidyltransferase-like protein
VLFGRFQPLHAGHIGLVRTVKKMGFDTHVIMNANVDTPDNRNPYNPHQKRTMFRLALPEVSNDKLHFAKVYLGGGGDVGEQARTLCDIFAEIAPPEKILICYQRKTEDIKSYIRDGKTHKGIHYVDMLTEPLGPFRQQDLSCEVILDYRNVCATDVREGRAPRDMVDPRVNLYCEWQRAQAEANSRRVGADPSSDRVFVRPPEEIADLTNQLIF